MVPSYVSEHGLRSDPSILRGGDACNAHVTRGLRMPIKIENSIILGVIGGVVSVVFVIEERNEVCCVVNTAEGLVRNGTDT